MNAKKTLIAIGIAGVMVACAAHAAPPRKHADMDGSRSPAVHHIPLYDDEGDPILPTDNAPQPFSLQNTCGDCHNYKTISGGFHFNPEAAAQARRYEPYRGEPWVLVDEATGTQLPFVNGPEKGLSPADVGLTAWEFTKRFARHMPGGAVYEAAPGAPPDRNARWEISGTLDINCLACHNVDREQNQSEYAIQCARENFRWAATAASWLGTVDNMASRLPDTYDRYVSPNLDNAWTAAPTVAYRKEKFDAKNRVFFDVRRQVPAERCYFCHSASLAGDPAEARWNAQKDVHMAAGMTCTDCHRNKLDHQIVTGREKAPGGDMYSCRGCHYGTGGDSTIVKPRAPHPKHKGFPPLHFEKLSCTACHSGPQPGDETHAVRTSRANRFGIHGRAHWDTDLPYIQAPVFERQSDGSIMPMYAVWPAFWGVKRGDAVKPLPLDRTSALVTQAITTSVPQDAPAKDLPAPETDNAAQAPSESADADATAAESAADAAVASENSETLAPPEATGETLEAEPPVKEPYTPLTDRQIAAALLALASSGEVDGAPVYVCSGNEYALNADGTLTVAADTPAAAPYRWQLGHDVRPASQALGAGGCTDCHAIRSPFYFATVSLQGPAVAGNAPTGIPMHRFLKESPAFATLWGLEFQVRPLFKLVMFATCALMASVLALYAFKGLAYLMKKI